MEQPKEKPTVAPGQEIGRWTVKDSFIFNAKGEKKWLCKCRCGTERYVLERSLRNGGSYSCGCLARERAKEVNAYNLQDKVFGDLKVVGRSRKSLEKRDNYWTCLCTNCGFTCDVTVNDLVTGKKTHCGCKTVKNYAYKDIRNKQFGRLTALYPTAQRSGNNGNVIWHCRCECKKEVDVSYNNLVNANVKSCGCQRQECDQKLRTFLVHVDGTSVDMLKSKKIPTDNTTGYKGVYRFHGKYIARIAFQKKLYHLGTYERIEDAAEARKEAEDMLFGETVQYYERWKAKADTDALWAEQNPIHISVSKLDGRRLQVTYTPQL